MGRKTDKLVSNGLSYTNSELTENGKGELSDTPGDRLTEDSRRRLCDIFGDMLTVSENKDERKNYLEELMNDKSLTEKERAYYKRILRVLEMPDLTLYEGHPINIVIRRILESDYFKDADHIKVPEIVSEWETFDLFNFPEDHVTRRPSDSYFLKKSEKPEDSILLRPHTSVMWYYYLIEGKGKEKLEETGEVKALSRGKAYRVDELDKTHHECFHQIDGLRITSKEKEEIDQDTLKNMLSNTIKALFGEDVEYRFNEDTFPYTLDSLEVEIYDEDSGSRVEILGAGVVHPTVLEKLGIDSNKYNGWAFGFGVEKVAMPMKKVPDIRMFWSDDERITRQRGDTEPFVEVSNFPPVYKDIAFLTSKDKFIKDDEESNKKGEIKLTKHSEADIFEISGIIRNISGEAGDLIEEVKIIDIYENDKKFGNDKKSVCIRISFRSLDRTLTNDEINQVYFEIRKKLEESLGFELR